MTKKKIAIVGGGGAGVTAAWLLDGAHDVTLFEAADQLGGHAFTHHLPQGETFAHVDMGVEYFNERLSPNLFAMHALFGLETFVAPLSFRAVHPGQGREWSNISTQGALRRELEPEMDRFHRDMAAVISAGDPRHKKMSIGDYLAERGYGESFKTQALLPLMTTFSGCDAPSLDYNLMYVAISINMGLLSFFAPGYWRKATAGIDGYIKVIEAKLAGKVRLATKVRSARSRQNGVEISTDTGSEAFDEVVFATHADTTLAMIEHPTEEQRSVLGHFQYVSVRSVMHGDASVLVAGGAEEYCQFRTFVDARGTPEPYGQLTRVNNALLAYAHVEERLLVTFDPKQRIESDRIHAEQQWKLPKLRPIDFQHKLRYRTIQGVGGFWYCGTDTSLTGHEGAVVSGMVIAERLGVRHPFAHDPMARMQFNVVKDIMGVRRRTDSVRAAVNDAIFAAAKRLSLVRNQSHKIITDAIV